MSEEKNNLQNIVPSPRRKSTSHPTLKDKISWSFEAGIILLMFLALHSSMCANKISRDAVSNSQQNAEIQRIPWLRAEKIKIVPIPIDHEKNIHKVVLRLKLKNYSPYPALKINLYFGLSSKETVLIKENITLMPFGEIVCDNPRKYIKDISQKEAYDVRNKKTSYDYIVKIEYCDIHKHKYTIEEKGILGKNAEVKSYEIYGNNL